MWQPIETAPRDGTKLLLCAVRGDEIAMCFGLAGDYVPVGDGATFRKATHWMPLPPPPANEEREGG